MTPAVEAFRRAAWLTLAPPARVTRARLLVQLAYVAAGDAEESAAPPVLDASGRVRRDAYGDVVRRPGDEAELARSDELYDLAREAQAEASGLYPKARGIDGALEEVFATARALLSEASVRDALELEIADAVFEDEAVLLAPSCSVGRYQAATSEGRTFACLDLRGVPIGAQGPPVAWSLDGQEQEWTANRAAAIFVAAEGVDAARAALTKWRER